MINKDYVAEILNIPKSKLEELIKKKIEEKYNLINEETAILLILKDFGINLEDLMNIKVKSLRSGMKINSIKLKINEILFKRDDIIIFDAGDETGMIKVIIKDKNWKIKENILASGKCISIRNGIVLNNNYLAIFVNNVKLIDEINENIDLYPYKISQVIGKVTKITDRYIRVITDKFTVIYLDPDKYQVEKNKNYIIKFYNKKPMELIEIKEYNI